MAYEATVTWNQEVLATGHRRINIYVIETGAGTGDAWSTEDGAANTVVRATNASLDQKDGTQIPIPPTFYIHQYKQELLDGSGASVQGTLGCPDVPGSYLLDTMDLMMQASTAGAYVFETTLSCVGFKPDRKRRVLSGMSNVDSGSDNTIHTHIILSSVA